MSADDLQDQLPDRAMSWSFALWGLFALALVLVASVLGLGVLGTSGRVPRDGAVQDQLIMASSGIDALARLEQTGMRGAYLIQLGTDSAFSTLDFASAIATDSILPDRAYPFPLVDVQSYYVQSLRPDNYTLVAARTGLARKVDHVVSPQLFNQVRESALSDPDPDISVAGDSVRINLQGEVRHILPRLPRTKERFAILINASYFSQTTPEALLEALRPYFGQISYIAVSEDADDPSVEPAARDSARRFVDLLVQGRS